MYSHVLSKCLEVESVSSNISVLRVPLNRPGLRAWIFFRGCRLSIYTKRILHQPA